MGWKEGLKEEMPHGIFADDYRGACPVCSDCGLLEAMRL